MRLEHLVPVDAPLVLSSQIQRSGGTLLSQLFDGHPECHAHPHEVKIGYPREHFWPPIELEQPENWFEILFEARSVRNFRRGYKKSPRSDQRDVFPFLFLARLQKQIFDACVAARPPRRERDVLDCYFTSYFNAWLDNHNLYSGPKKAVTGFTPRLAMDAANVERYFAAYPDGTLISIVRDPRSWFVSASRYAPQDYGDVSVAMELWGRSVDAALDALAQYGERVVVLTYEQLVLETEATMRALAERLGIAVSAVLLEPTFNGRAIRANSIEPVEQRGVLRERVDAYRTSLEPEQAALIAERAGDRYERAAAAAST
jgi:hypothetical protein